jgi:polysaccharide pyruvyl transferase CsaB
MSDLTNHILIAGYYGFNNTGDEVILSAMIHDLSLVIPALSITVICGDPQQTRQIHSVNAIAWTDIRGIKEAIQACDLVILGGGGLFHDYWGVDTSSILTAAHMGIAFYYSISLLASIYKKPMMLYAVGVGPVISDEAKRYVRVIAENCAAITVRDTDSKAILVSLGLPAARITITTDPAFGLLLPQKRMAKIDEQFQGFPIVGVALRNWDVGVDPKYWEAQVATALDAFLDRHSTGLVVFIPFQDVQETLLDDTGISRRVRKTMKNSSRTKIIPRNSSFLDREFAISKCDLVLGMRLHALIGAVSHDIPIVGLIYDPKVMHLMSQLRIKKYALPINEITDDRLLKMIEYVFEQRETIAVGLHQKRELLTAKAGSTARLAADLLAAPAHKPPVITEEKYYLLEQGILSLSNNFDELTISNLSLRDSITAIKNMHEESEKRSQEEIQNLGVQLVSLKNTIIEKENEIKDLNNQQIILSNSIAELETRVKNLTESLHEAITAHQEREKELLSSIQAHVDQEQELLRQNATYQNRSKELLQKNRDLETSLNDRIYQHEQQLSEIKSRAESQISELKAYSEHRVFELQNQNERKYSALQQESSKQIDELKNQVDFQANELGSIKSSKGWKLLWSLWQTRLFFVPHGSRREKALNSVWAGLKKTNTAFRNTSRGIRNRLRKKNPILLSRYAYAFFLYRKERRKKFAATLERLHVPCFTGQVSIILPVYNGAAMVGEAIESILQQTYKQFELIIVDDGSTDATGAIVDSYAQKDCRIRVIHQENQKLPRSLNNGFAMAHGEYLTWTSDDNRLKPDFLIRMVECLSRHPDWDMVYANMDIIGEDGYPLRNSSWYAGYQVPFGSEHIHLPRNTLELNTYPNNFIGGAFLYRARVKSVLEGYDPLQFTREDYDAWMQMNALLTVKHVPFDEPVYEYRFHASSLTSQDDDLKITQDRKYLMVFDDFRRDFTLMPGIWIIDDRVVEAKHRDVVKQLINALGHKNQVLLSLAEVGKMQLPEAGIPMIYLQVTDDPLSKVKCPEYLNSKTMKGILCLNCGDLPDASSQDWDVCLAWGKGDTLPRLDPLPEGWWETDDLETLISALDIKVRAKQLRKSENYLSNPTDDELKVSVIICTFQRVAVLEKALCAIADQTIPHQDYEVLVVDNHPVSGELEGLIEKIRSGAISDFPDHVRLLHCPVLGLSYARNAGLYSAKSEVLLFLDDDAVAERDVLEQTLKAYEQNPETGVIGGHIILHRPEKLGMVWKAGWERYWSQFVTGYGTYTNVTQWWEFPWGANWSARRKALTQVGGFRGRYGRHGNDFNGGEEIVAASLIQQLGYSVAVLPQSSVTHYVEPARFTLNHLKNTILSGLMVHYLAQQNLHLPVEASLKSASQQVMKAIRRYLSLLFSFSSTEKKAARLEASYHLSARFFLLKRQIQDGLRRIQFFQE